MLLVILGVGWLLSSICMVHLWWAQNARWWRKAVWSVVLLLPYVGPLFYGALFQPLPVQPKELRAQSNADVYAGAPGDPQ